jgi:hypothetical protein
MEPISAINHLFKHLENKVKNKKILFKEIFFTLNN